MEERLKEILDEMVVLEDREENLLMIPLYEEALELSRKVYGEYSLKTLEIYNNFGGHLRNLGMYERAENLLRKAVRCAERIRGRNHPDYATSLVNLANLLRMMRQWKESEELFLKAKEIYDRTIGNDHFLYAGILNNLGLLYQEMGQNEKALHYFNEDLAYLEGKEEYIIPYAITLHNVSDLYQAEGKRKQAEEYLKREIEIYRNMKYEGTVLYAAALNSLGILYYEDGSYVRACDVMKESVEIAEKHLGTESESYQNGKKNLLMITEKMKRENQMKKQELPESEWKGMDICRAYFEEVCYPVLEKEFGQWLPRMAAGMVGEGSECYGYDDEISRDHDFGPSFQIFIPREDMPVYGERLQQRLAHLPKKFRSFPERTEEEYGGGRTGVLTIEDFYRKFIGVEGVPDQTVIWRQIPENALSTVTNGEVFFDHPGWFTAIRKELKKGYPEDVRLKKIAARLMKMAQSGQYNFPRCIKRKEFVAAHLALSEFMSVTMSLVYLLNHGYRPYYKWVHRGLKDLPILGKKTADGMERLSTLSISEKGEEMQWIIEEICNSCLEELKRQGLTDDPEKFLLVQGPQVLKRIRDEKLRNSNPWVE